MAALTTLGRSAASFVATALAEIVGRYLPYLWLRKAGLPWLSAPASVALGVFSPW